MKHWKILLPATLLISVLWLACRDQEYNNNYQQQADVAFAGRVIDEDGQPIEGAQVRADGELAVTDVNGVFRTKTVQMPARDAKLTVTRIGYFDFSRAFIVQDDALQTVTIQLLRKQLVGSFSAASGGTVQVPGGVTLNFPAGAVNTTGQVRVFARYLDPASPQLSLHMPGDLRGINAGGEEGTLSTFGMLAVEMTDQAGQELQIAGGNEVEISMPIPADKLGVAPASVPLWHYDHAQARWIEEGSAQKTGNQYVGKVKHFSFWNCDAFSATVYMEGKVFLRDDQHPLANAHIRLTVVSNGFQGYGFTNAEGWFGGAVPKDYALKLEVILPDQCGGGQVLYTEDIGPFSADVVLPSIIIVDLPPTAPALTISGKVVDCGGQAVSSGYAKITVGSTTLTAFTDPNGEFELALINCNNSTSGEAIGYDLVNLLESPVQNFSISGNSATTGDLQACNALSEFIQFSLDGQTFTHVDVSGGVYADSSGQTSTTYLFSADSLQNQVINLSFQNNNQTGTFPLVGLYVNGLEVSNPATVSTTVTAFGPVGNPITGTFSGNFQDMNGASHTLSGSYKVIRDW